MSAYPCECGDTHMSALAKLYCSEAIEADDRAARRPPPAWRDNNIIKAYD